MLLAGLVVALVVTVLARLVHRRRLRGAGVVGAWQHAAEALALRVGPADAADTTDVLADRIEHLAGVPARPLADAAQEAAFGRTVLVGAPPDGRRRPGVAGGARRGARAALRRAVAPPGHVVGRPGTVARRDGGHRSAQVTRSPVEPSHAVHGVAPRQGGAASRGGASSRARAPAAAARSGRPSRSVCARSRPPSRRATWARASRSVSASAGRSPELLQTVCDADERLPPRVEAAGENGPRVGVGLGELAGE